MTDAVIRFQSSAQGRDENKDWDMITRQSWKFYRTSHGYCFYLPLNNASPEVLGAIEHQNSAGEFQMLHSNHKDFEQGDGQSPNVISVSLTTRAFGRISDAQAVKKQAAAAPEARPA